jgi:hypothetical protein
MPGNAFQPNGSTFALTVDVTSNRIELVGLGNAGRVVRIANPSAANPVGIRFGDSSVAAVILTDMVIAPLAVEYFVVPGQSTYLAAICNSASGALKVTLGSM